MNEQRYDWFFTRAFGDKTKPQSPLDYQCRLACGDEAQLSNPYTLVSGCNCRSLFINIPTGLGKTAAIILAWLWNRVQLQDPRWPRRLVYCLPMRTLVEQTCNEVHRWLQNLGLANNVHATVLMGGEEVCDWDVYPERLAILIGTQDMLLSRALNRGYGMSRYRWPMDFGLLNNDCLWVMDEVQLMGPGLSTACQLEAFRLRDGSASVARFNSYPEGRSVTWYASATANREHLQTKDWRGIKRPDSFFVELSENDKSAPTGTVAERQLAMKRLELQEDWNFGDRRNPPSAEVMETIIERHRQMVCNLKSAPAELPRRTLVMCNTVDRAIAVHNGIRQKLFDPGEVDLLLMHSRFRLTKRQQQVDRLRNSEPHPGGQIVIATQVIEAGVDLSSAILWTEIAPLMCLAQRLGRLNRKGEFGYNSQVPFGFAPVAIVVGIEAPDSTSKKKKEEKEAAQKEAERRYLPYQKAKCDEAWNSLEKLGYDASPAALMQIGDTISASIDRCPYSLQKHELLDFFDTEANLSLGFTDVSPFVRGIDSETDFYVAWRDWPGSNNGEKPQFSADFQRQELCPVPKGKDAESRAVLSKGWLWRGKEAGWASVAELDIMPGMTILLPTEAGGYEAELGWTGNKKDGPVRSVYALDNAPSDEEMLSSLNHGWQSISQHTAEVESEWLDIIKELDGAGLSRKEQAAVLRGVYWHDTGKNHPVWQCSVKDALDKARISPPDNAFLIAKFSLSGSPRLHERNEDGTPKFSGEALKKELRVLRQSFKPSIAHEVASSLAFRQSEQSVHNVHRPIESLLAEYLIMSHHGRVRKVLRDEIPKQPRTVKDAESVRGVSNGTELPEVTVGGQTLGCASLSTDCRRMGRDADGNESYTRGVLRLLDYYGPFRLAFFEALFRAADIRASIRASEQAQKPEGK